MHRILNKPPDNRLLKPLPRRPRNRMPADVHLALGALEVRLGRRHDVGPFSEACGLLQLEFVFEEFGFAGFEALFAGGL